MTLCHAKRKIDPFTRISKDIVFDSRISWKAKGILLYAFSRPEDWTFYKKEMRQHASDGREAFDSGIAELKKYGYIHTLKKRKENGMFCGFEWFFFEDPITDEEFQKIITEEENPTFGQPAPTKKEYTKKNISLLSKDKKDTFQKSPQGRLSFFLFSLIKENNPKARKPNFEAWAKAMKKIITKSASRPNPYTEAEVEQVIRWAMKHQFWKTNILSADKLEKQIDTLFAQMNNPQSKAEQQRQIDENKALTAKKNKQFAQDFVRDKKYTRFGLFPKDNGVEVKLPGGFYILGFYEENFRDLLLNIQEKIEKLKL